MARPLLFDVFGTLLDVHAAPVPDGMDPRTFAAVIETWRTKQLTYSWLRGLMAAPGDFADASRDALAYALRHHGLAGTAAESTLPQAVSALPPFPDVGQALERLAKAGHRLGVLTNGPPAMARDALDQAGLGAWFDPILSAADADRVKPHPAVYQLAVDALHLPPQEIMLVSSNAWDIAGAAHFGLTAIWVNRTGETDEELPAGPAHVLTSLTELPTLLGAPSD